MKFKAAVIALVLGMLIWLGLNGTLSREVVITGVIITVIASLFYIGFRRFQFSKGNTSCIGSPNCMDLRFPY